jgi:plastocyanin
VRLGNILTARLVLIVVVCMAFGIIAGSHVASGRASRPAADCPGVCVDLKEDQASPDAISVPVGTQVQFNARDDRTRNLGLGKGGHAHHSDHEHIGDFTSGDFGAGEAWKVEFKEVGVYEFHDHYQPDVRITVVVYRPGADYEVR